MNEELKLKGWLQAFLNWPIYLSAIVVALTIVAYTVNLKAGLISTVFAAAYIAVAAWFYIVKKPMIMKELMVFAIDHAQMQKQLLSELNVPYALLDEQKKILWTNESFNEIFRPDKVWNKKFLDLFSEIEDVTPDEKNGKEELFDVAYNDKFYRLHLKNVYSVNTSGSEAEQPIDLIAAYLFDRTNEIRFQRELENQRMVAGLVYLDNYEEALESIEEVRRSLLMALIDRKISKYFSNMKGIVKKLEKDKYLVVLQNAYVEQLRSNKFSLLEDVKTVNIGNDMTVTLSIGMGCGGDSYQTNYEYARSAIDMALGRGGDQAVIKDGDSVHYYGGKSQTQEKNTRVKARVKAHALKELIETRDEVFIMGHKIGDIDSLGAGVGIYRACCTLNKRAHIVLDNVTSSVRPMKERFHGKEYGEDMFISGERALEMANGNSLLVVVDVNRPGFTECPKLLEKIPTVVVLDHHRQTREVITNAVLSYVEPYASSACEMVAEILQYIGDNVRVRQVEADAMYGGIVIDTNNFLNKTGVRTFEAAAFLRRCGADVTRVRKMFRDSAADNKAKADAVSRADIFEGAYAISDCCPDGIESPTVIGAQAANDLLDIVGIRASFVLTPYQNQIYISARSIDEVNVQLVMEKLGGGGHMSVAGAQLPDCSVEEAKEKLKTVILQMLEDKEI